MNQDTCTDLHVCTVALTDAQARDAGRAVRTMPSTTVSEVWLRPLEAYGP